MRKRTAAFLIALVLALSFALPAFSESSEIPDGRWLCADIQENVTADTAAALKDDFGLYVNKDWILEAVIPDGESTTGSFEDVVRTMKDRQIGLMKDDSLTGHDADLVRKLYALVTDWDYRNALGTEPVMPEFESLRAIDSLEALTAYLYNPENILRFFPLTMNVDADMTDPGLYISQIHAPSLMLKDSAEYTERTPAGSLYDLLSRQTGAYMLGQLGCSEEEAAVIIDNAFAFESLMAAHIKAQATHYEPDYYASILNYYTPEELAELAGGFPILEMIRAYGLKIGKSYLVSEPDYVAALPELYTEENTALIRDWITLKAANSLANLLDQETYRQVEAITNMLMGVSGETSEDDNALSAVLGLLPVPMDNLYIRKYCTEKQRDDMLKIISLVLENYHSILETTDWLSEETRAKAIEKLDHIRIFAVYPDELADWSGLDFAGVEENGSLVAANAAVQNYLVSILSDRIDTALDRDKWDQLMIQTSQVNAFYNPSANSINIMAGILSGNIYNEEMSFEQMLGGIGSVIGHEISHAFDTNGAQFDMDGALADWWTEEDKAAFQERAAKLAAWYDGFIPVEGAVYSGQQVQTEAIADMGGTKCMLAIAAQTEEFDYDAFFRQYATIWRMQGVPSRIVLQIAGDVHPMRYLRVNATLAQFEDFLSFYGIEAGDGMHIAPEDRVAVW